MLCYRKCSSLYFGENINKKVKIMFSYIFFYKLYMFPDPTQRKKNHGIQRCFQFNSKDNFSKLISHCWKLVIVRVWKNRQRGPRIVTGWKNRLRGVWVIYVRLNGNWKFTNDPFWPEIACFKFTQSFQKGKK